MESRLTAEPGTLEFSWQLLEIARESGHPIDKALTKVLSKQIGEAGVIEEATGGKETLVRPTAEPRMVEEKVVSQS